MSDATIHLRTVLTLSYLCLHLSHHFFHSLYLKESQTICMITGLDLSKECVKKKKNLISQPKHMFVGTQKNRLDETVLLSAQNIC